MAFWHINKAHQSFHDFCANHSGKISASDGRRWRLRNHSITFYVSVDEKHNNWAHQNYCWLCSSLNNIHELCYSVSMIEMWRWSWYLQWIPCCLLFLSRQPGESHKNEVDQLQRRLFFESASHFKRRTGKFPTKRELSRKKFNLQLNNSFYTLLVKHET